MDQPLVVGIDGSESALRALDWAVDEAERHGVPLRIVFASLWEPYETSWPPYVRSRPAGRSVPDHIVAVALDRAVARNAAVKPTAALLAEDTVRALLRESRRASALVVGDRGRGQLAGLLAGSVALAVAEQAECPVIVVRGQDAGVRGEHHRVLLGVREGGKGTAATQFALSEAEVRDRRLNAVHAWRCPERGLPVHPHTIGGAPDPHLRDAQWALQHALRVSAAEHPEVAVHGETYEGQARDGLLQAAATADLLVTGRAPGRLGAVAQALLHYAPCPVAVVPEEL